MMTIPLLYFLLSFLTYEVSYSKKKTKNFKRKCEICFCDWLSNCILGNYFLKLTHQAKIGPKLQK